MDIDELKRRTPHMTNVIGGLFYQGWYEDRSANESLDLAFGYRSLEERLDIVGEIDVLLGALPTESAVEEFVQSFDVDVDFQRDFDGDVRRWLSEARRVVKRLPS